MAQYLAICDRKDVNALVSAECEALTGSKPAQDGIAICQKIEAIQQSAYVHRGLQIIAKADSIQELVEEIGSLDFPADDEKFFFRVIKAAFGKRRKTLKNSLSGSELGIDAQTAVLALNSAGIDPVRRAETLTVEEFVKLSNLIEAPRRRADGESSTVRDIIHF